MDFVACEGAAANVSDRPSVQAETTNSLWQLTEGALVFGGFHSTNLTQGHLVQREVLSRSLCIAGHFQFGSTV